MGTELQVFRFERYPVRVVVDETGGPWWVAKDVCDVLDLTNPSVAIESLEEDERAKFNLGRQGEAWMVNEPGLYSMVLRSRKPEARRFRRWVVHDVLPAIRKSGRYEFQGRRIPQNFQEAIRALADEVDLREHLEAENRKLAPKAIAWDATCQEGSDMSLQAVAKEFQRLGTGPRRIFSFLADQGILYRLDGSWVPHQRYLESGYFRVKRTQIEIGDVVRTRYRTMVTPKGRDLIARLLAINVVEEVTT